jgi:hypothetical protein
MLRVVRQGTRPQQRQRWPAYRRWVTGLGAEPLTRANARQERAQQKGKRNDFMYFLPKS